VTGTFGNVVVTHVNDPGFGPGFFVATCTTFGSPGGFTWTENDGQATSNVGTVTMTCPEQTKKDPFLSGTEGNRGGCAQATARDQVIAV